MSSGIFIVMGVCGCGKSTVGSELARALDLPFLEGDSLHPPRNVELMAAGVPLTDADRAGWLHALAERISLARAAGQGLVVSCSALKRAYRDVLRGGAADLQLVYLQGEREVLAARMAARGVHYMPLSLLDSQLQTLEPPVLDENAWTFDVSLPARAIVAQVTELA